MSDAAASYYLLMRRGQETMAIFVDPGVPRVLASRGAKLPLGDTEFFRRALERVCQHFLPAAQIQSRLASPQ
jgi:hypothetical protein